MIAFTKNINIFICHYSSLLRNRLKRTFYVNFYKKLQDNGHIQGHRRSDKRQTSLCKNINLNSRRRRTQGWNTDYYRREHEMSKLLAVRLLNNISNQESKF